MITYLPTGHIFRPVGYPLAKKEVSLEELFREKETTVKNKFEIKEKNVRLIDEEYKDERTLNKISKVGLFDQSVATVHSGRFVKYDENGRKGLPYFVESGTYLLAVKSEDGALNKTSSVVVVSSEEKIERRLNPLVFNKYNLVQVDEETDVAVTNTIKILNDLEDDGIEAVFVTTSDYGEYFVKTVNKLVRTNEAPFDKEVIKEANKVITCYKKGDCNEGDFQKLALKNKKNNFANLYLLSLATASLVSKNERQREMGKVIFEAMKNSGTKIVDEPAITTPKKNATLSETISSALEKHYFYPNTRGFVFLLSGEIDREGLESSLESSLVKIKS